MMDKLTVVMLIKNFKIKQNKKLYIHQDSGDKKKAIKELLHYKKMVLDMHRKMVILQQRMLKFIYNGRIKMVQFHQYITQHQERMVVSLSIYLNHFKMVLETVISLKQQEMILLQLEHGALQKMKNVTKQLKVEMVNRISIKDYREQMNLGTLQQESIVL